MVVEKKQKLKKKNQRFAALFALVFAMLFLSTRNEYSKYIWFSMAFIFTVLGIFRPLVLQSLRVLWLKLGLALNKITSPVFLSLFFFVFFAPFSMVIRLFKKNNFGFKDAKVNTYGIQSSDVETFMHDQF